MCDYTTVTRLRRATRWQAVSPTDTAPLLAPPLDRDRGNGGGRPSSQMIPCHVPEGDSWHDNRGPMERFTSVLTLTVRVIGRLLLVGNDGPRLRAI
jgi:hypothetical protein